MFFMRGDEAGAGSTLMTDYRDMAVLPVQVPQAPTVLVTDSLGEVPIRHNSLPLGPVVTGAVVWRVHQ